VEAGKAVEAGCLSSSSRHRHHHLPPIVCTGLCTYTYRRWRHYRRSIYSIEFFFEKKNLYDYRCCRRREECTSRTASRRKQWRSRRRSRPRRQQQWILLRVRLQQRSILGHLARKEPTLAASRVPTSLLGRAQVDRRDRMQLGTSHCDGARV
jgi:hypothetical protein